MLNLTQLLSICLFLTCLTHSQTPWPLTINSTTYNFQILSFTVNNTNPSRNATRVEFASTLYVQKSINWWYNQYLSCDIFDERWSRIGTCDPKLTVSIPKSPYATTAGDKIPFVFSYKTFAFDKYFKCMVKDFGNTVYLEFYAILPAYKVDADGEVEGQGNGQFSQQVRNSRQDQTGNLKQGHLQVQTLIQ